MRNVKTEIAINPIYTKMTKRLKNPFLLTGYYGADYFCDREQELKHLKAHFDNERNVVIFSWRRLGKTAMIRLYMMMLESGKQAETLYVDLLGTKDLDSAIAQISRVVYEKYGNTKSGISHAIQTLLGRVGAEISFDPLSGQPKINIALNDKKLSIQSLQAIGEFLQDRKQTILIALDEFQQVQHYSEVDAEAVFRTWMQTFPSIRFLFSGSHRTMMQAMFTEKKRPFYRSAQLMQLHPIPLESYRPFIKRHFKKHQKSISDAAIDALYHWSRGQTYCVQLVCNKLFGQYDAVTEKELLIVYQEIIEQESAFFSAYIRLLTDMQWKVLKAIAVEEPLEQPTSKEFIQKHRLGAASSVSTALKMLEKTETVVKEESSYLVQDVLLARWLQRLA